MGHTIPWSRVWLREEVWAGDKILASVVRLTQLIDLMSVGFILTQTALLSLFKFTFLMPKFGTSLSSIESYLKTSVVWTPERAGPGTVLQRVASLLMNTLGNRFPRPQVLEEVVPSVQGIVSTGQSFWTPMKKRIEVRLARFPLNEHRLAFGAVFPKYTCKLPSSNYWLYDFY